MEYFRYHSVNPEILIRQFCLACEYLNYPEQHSKLKNPLRGMDKGGKEKLVPEALENLNYISATWWLVKWLSQKLEPSEF